MIRERLVNLNKVALEPPEDVKFTWESVPGLKPFLTLGGKARGCIQTNNRAFVVFGSSLYEIFAGGTSIVRGTLNTNEGPVSMAYGLFQIVIVDGPGGYVFRLSENTFGPITDDGFYGSPVVRFEDNVFLFVRPDTQQFYISAINDATMLDALDFASAESQPDNLVTLEVDHSEIYLFGQYTTEIWFNSGASDFPFQRSQGSGMEVGCVAAQSVRQIDNSIFWLGRDRNGSGLIYRAVGHQPQRISTHNVETDIQKSSDPTKAVAYVYQESGLTFYCINAPGMLTTWCFEVASGEWHERCDLDPVGNFKAKRTAIALFAFGRHFEGADDGNLYELDHATYRNGADHLVREMTTPRFVTKDGYPIFFQQFMARLATGGAAQGQDPKVQLSWTDNQGKDWSNPLLRSLGKVGEIMPVIRWFRVGASKDRTWRLRCSANVPFSIREARPL